MKKILLIAGASVAALIALCGVAWGATSALAKSQTKTATVTAPVRSVVLDVDVGDVTLVRGGTVVSVRDRLHWSLSKPSVSQHVVDGVLTVKAECHGGFPFANCRTNLRVSVPDGVAVRARTNVGDVRGHGLVNADLDAQTHVGDVELGLNHTPSRLRAISDVGDVTVAVPHSTYAVDSDSDVGDRDVTGLVQDDRAARSIHAQTNVGDVRVQGH